MYDGGREGCGERDVGMGRKGEDGKEEVREGGM